MGTSPADGSALSPRLRTSRSLAVAGVLVLVGSTVASPLILRAVAELGAVIRVSGSMTGGDANAMSSAPDVSANGRIVTFASDASNLVDGDTNGIVDVFAWDRANGTTQRVSVNSAGQQQDGWCHPFPVVSGSGRFVAFLSGARNLAPGATNFACHTYVRDLVAGTTEIVSVSSSGGIANGNGADWPAITPDGRYVAFTSYASNLVPNDTNSQPDVFLRDRATGTTTLVSATPAGIVGTRESGLPDVSDDGRFVVFTSASTDLVPGDANGNGGDVYLRDTIAGTTERVSVSSSGVQGAGTGCCTSVSISPDGRYVLFATSAGNLVGGDTNNAFDIFLRDRQLGTTERVSLTSGGEQANGSSDDPDMSADGRFVAFHSHATNVVADDTNGETDLFVRDRLNGTTTRVSVGPGGAQADGPSSGADIDANGRFVAMHSGASNLTSGDANGTFDVFLVDTRPGESEDITSPQIFIDTPSDGSTFPQGEPIAADYACVDEDGGSGVVECTGSVAAGDLLDVSTPGSYPFTVTARDAAGNQTSSSVTYEIVAPPPPSEEPSPEPSETPPPPSEEPSPEPSPAEPPDGPLVQAAGTELRLEGEPYEFIGMNVYNANTRVHSCWYPFTQGQLEDSFTEMGGEIDVIRAWFFQDFATAGGTRSWTAFDETFAAAEATGKKVIVTLGNHWGDCDSEGTKTAEWYGGGYRERNAALPSSYRDFVAEVVSRYGHRSSILMWQLLNEAEVPLFTSEGLCDEGIAHVLLKGWAADVSSLIKSIDPHHLVSIGTIGSGQCGAQYTDFKSLHELPTVDLCEFHDYGTAVMPGDQWNGLAFRIEQCGELDKPIFVGETGITPNWLDGTLQARAELFRDKFTAQMGAGVVGEVLWAWNADESLTVTYDIGPGDPIFAMLAGLNAPDADGDGVADTIDTGNATFSNGVTSGAVNDAAGHTVSVVPEGSDEVRITVAGTGTLKASFTVCGFTLRMAPGNEVVVGCGSITTRVVRGAAELVLGGGLTVVTVPGGVTATVDDLPDGSFLIDDISGGNVAVVVDGTSSSVGPGQTLTLETWDFVGFAAPVDNGNVLNVVKAGTSVPLKWRLLDGDGSPVSDLETARVTVASLACSAGTSADQLEEAGSGTSSLQNLGNGYYQLNWKTPKNYANSCKTMRLDIGDGVVHTALFQFKK